MRNFTQLCEELEYVSEILGMEFPKPLEVNRTNLDFLAALLQIRYQRLIEEHGPEKYYNVYFNYVPFPIRVRAWDGFLGLRAAEVLASSHNIDWCHIRIIECGSIES